MDEPKASEELVRFGPFEFDPVCLELRRRGVRVRIQGQPLQVLALLVRHPNILVTRETLRQALWPDGTFVDFEHGLNAAVRRLRRALGDGAKTPRFIQTLARRGYRFAALVDSSGPLTCRSNEPLPRSLAVLPFENATGDPESEYVVDGITEGLINALAASPDVRVIARSAVFRPRSTRMDPRALGRRLGVDAVVVGSIGMSPRSGMAISARAELVDVARGFQIWGGSCERPLDDLPNLERELARHVHDALQLRANRAEHHGPKAGAPSGAAHREYLKGRHFLNQMNEGSIRRAANHFATAAAADGRYALAYCGLAECYTLFAFLGLDAPNRVLPKASEAARTALSLDGQLAEAHATLASVTKIHEWNWQDAESGYRQALTLNPSYAAAHRWYAAHLAAVDRRRDALAAIERAAELDPVSPLIVTELAWYAYMAREFETARLHAMDALDLQPGFPPALFTLGLANEQLGAYDEALEAFQAAAAPSPNPAVVASHAHLLALMGRRDEALAQGNRLKAWSCERYVPPYWFAILAAALKGPQDALTWLERAVEQHDVWLVWLKREPRFDRLRPDDRFQRVLNRIGLGNPRVTPEVSDALSTSLALI